MSHELHGPREAYLAHSLEPSDAERQEIDSFEDWLPDDIIDAHAHSNLSEHVDFISDEAYRHMLSTFPSYSIEESRNIQRIFHPGKQIKTLRFAKTFRGVNHRQANAYLLDGSPEDDRVALFGLPEDVDYTVDMLSHPRVSALKMYYSYVNPPVTKIYDVFKPEILEVAQERDVPIVLHVPKIITKSVSDVVGISRDFPDLRIAIAHLGSTKFNIPGLREAYKELADNTEVYLDTSLNPSGEVCSLALSIFGMRRVMYGSDEPLNLLRSVPYEHPDKGQRIATSYEYHWVDPEDHARYSHLAEGAVHSHWLALGALRYAISSLPEECRDEAKRRVFHDNAEEFYDF